LKEDNEATLSRLFVYGIFLGEYARDRYHMSNPKYATVRDYATFGVTQDGNIVEAARVTGLGMVLTGLVVDVDPNAWEYIDSLESGYDRVQIVTTDKERAYMYVRKEWK